MRVCLFLSGRRYLPSGGNRFNCPVVAKAMFSLTDTFHLNTFSFLLKIFSAVVCTPPIFILIYCCPAVFSLKKEEKENILKCTELHWTPEKVIQVRFGYTRNKMRINYVCSLVFVVVVFVLKVKLHIVVKSVQPCKVSSSSSINLGYQWGISSSCVQSGRNWVCLTSSVRYGLMRLPCGWW